MLERLLIGIPVVVVLLLVGPVLLPRFRSEHTVLAGVVAVPVVLLAHWLRVALPISAMARLGTFPPGTIRVLTCGGFRGGISVALARSLPAAGAKGLIVTMTRLVVAFLILVQGLALGRAARRT